MNYFMLVSAWFVYFLVHSVLAAEPVKAWVTQRLPVVGRHYRAVYSTISTIGLVLIVYYQLALPGSHLFYAGFIWKAIGFMLITAGLFVIGIAFRWYDTRVFLGITQAPPQEQFIRKGILNKVRHPIYSGTLLMVGGLFLIFPTLAMAIGSACIFVYLPIGIYFEERKLVRQFGSAYLIYRREVPAIIPDFDQLFQKIAKN